MNCFVGVDVGTTNVKALALSPDLSQILAHASAPLTTLHPQPGYAEQDPTEIWSAFVQVMTEVCREIAQGGHVITHVAFCTAMHSLLPMEADGTPPRQRHSLVRQPGRSTGRRPSQCPKSAGKGHL